MLQAQFAREVAGDLFREGGEDGVADIAVRASDIAEDTALADGADSLLEDPRQPARCLETRALPGVKRGSCSPI